jgi:ketosteroid isomerase-like protein
MKRIGLLTLTFIAAAFFAACGGAAENNPAASNAKPANANAAAKLVAAAPTADALMALDKQANEAYLKGDSKFFEGFLSDKFVMREGGQRMDKAAVVKMIAGVKCDAKTWNLDEQQMAKIDADTYVLSYRGTWDGTCTGPDGKSTKIPSPTRAATVWVRSGDKWQAAFHGDNLIIDPRNLPKAATAPPAKPADTKHQARPAAPPPDPSTDAMVALETFVWEAWKVHDAKKLEDVTTNDLSFIDIFGNSFANKADTIKAWTGAICEIRSVSVTDGVASALSPTVELLTHKGTADGTCYGQKVGAVHGTSVYVKDGDAWKLAFSMNMPTM